MADVEIYTKPTCPFCMRAKGLLESKNVQFTEHHIAGNNDLREKMIERTGGRSTVPQIFINNKRIGGCDELHALEADGELDGMLND